MPRLIITLAALILAAPATAEPLGRILQSDGPYIDLPEGVIINAAAPSLADIRVMADLDGDPSVTTREEERMIALLSAVLLSAPIAH